MCGITGFIDTTHASTVELLNNMSGVLAHRGPDDAGHAFYLGQELTKAELALQLGKNYTQDRPLWWGYLSTVD